jgi:hypothetical protein
VHNATDATRLQHETEQYEKHAANEPDWVRPDKPRAATSLLHHGRVQRLEATACTCRPVPLRCETGFGASASHSERSAATSPCVRVADAAGDARAPPRGVRSSLAIDESESARLDRAKQSFERYGGPCVWARSVGFSRRVVCAMQAHVERGRLGKSARAACARSGGAYAQAECCDDGVADGDAVGRADAGVAYQRSSGARDGCTDRQPHVRGGLGEAEA